MKKNRHTKSQGPKSQKKTVKVVENTEKTEEPAKVNPFDDENQGFGGWLTSTDGMENMKYFVLANSILMLTTVAYPHIQKAFTIITEMIFGYDEFH